jgi:hypothetical protein
MWAQQFDLIARLVRSSSSVHTRSPGIRYISDSRSSILVLRYLVTSWVSTMGRSYGKTLFGFHLAGMVGHDFFKPYAVTFDFMNMQIFLQ